MESYNFATINICTITNETKLNALRNFIRTLDLDIVFLQEVATPELTIPGFNVITNVDHARRGTAIALKNHFRFTHVEKSIDSRLIALRIEGNVVLCNIYAPSGSQMRAQRERFFNETIAYYLRQTTAYTILAGDFNAVISARDSSGESNFSNSLKNTIQQLRLHDAWEKINGNRPGHTYITHNSTSRLDRAYISSALDTQLRTAYTHVCSFTNHKALSIRICLPSQGREYGRGFWSLRPHVLVQQNMQEFQLKWNYWTRQKRNYPTWLQWWVNFTKPKIKSFFRWKTREAYDEYNRSHQVLYGQLQAAYDAYYQDQSLLPTINRLKAKMLMLQRHHTNLFVRINETRVDGEPLSTFQIGERTRRRTTIDTLEVGPNHTIESSDEILEHVSNYYRELFTQGEMQDTPMFTCERVVPQSCEINNSCLDPITTEDIFSAIKASASRKSPGPDGIPKEFYLVAFDHIHREINLMLNEVLTGNVPSEFLDGIIVLVKKKNAGNTIKSYRPISLLNYDYKLFSRIITARLDRVLRQHHVLTSSQKCANGENNIFQATLALKSKIAELHTMKRKGKLVSFDLDHAFDRVDRNFLLNTMRSLGINEGLIQLFSILGSRSSSRILINGHLSRSFPIERSVRQGDPISMMLFVIYLHPLLTQFDSICGSEDLIVAYADDISMIATSIETINRAREIFSHFQLAAGAILNMQKTLSVDVGHIRRGLCLSVPWLRTEDRIKILGVIYANSVRFMTKLNWDHLVTNFAKQLWLHRMRTLTIHQKITLLNTFITSRIWYMASILSPFNIHIAKLTSLMGSFIWTGQAARIPIQQLALPIERGGLKLQLPSLKCKALLINRHLKELDSIPFYRTNILNPRPTLPTSCPCLVVIHQFLHTVPTPIQTNVSIDMFHRHFLNTIEPAKVERDNPQIEWKTVWRNISSKKLSSPERSWYYLLANGKVSHQHLLFRINRVNTPACLHCGAANEDLDHKFSTCPRVAEAWRCLTQLTTLESSMRRISFRDLAQPTLKQVSRTNRIKIMKLFINYIKHVCNSENTIDVNRLKLELQLAITN